MDIFVHFTKTSYIYMLYVVNDASNAMKLSKLLNFNENKSHIFPRFFLS